MSENEPVFHTDIIEIVMIQRLKVAVFDRMSGDPELDFYLPII